MMSRSTWFSSLGLRARLVLPICLIVLLAGGIRTWSIADEEFHLLNDRLAARAAFIERSLAPVLVSHVEAGRLAEMESLLRDLALDARQSIAELAWHDGKRRFAFQAPIQPAIYPDWFARMSQPLRTRWTVALDRSGASLGSFEFTLDATPLMDLAWRRVNAQVRMVGMVIGLLLLLVVTLTATTLRGLRRIRSTAVALKAGDYSRRADTHGVPEIRAVAEALNALIDKTRLEMARRSRLEETLRERWQMLDRILKTMSEAVILTDRDLRLVMANPAAGRLIHGGFVLGESLPAILRNPAEGGLLPLEWPALREIARREGQANIPRLSLAMVDGQISVCSLLLQPLEIPGDDNPGWLVVLTDITRSEWLIERAEWQAAHDSLTGLSNRLLLADRINRACLEAERNGHLCAVCLFDLDEFKKINDLHGHETGDHVLVEIARRIVDSLRGTDTVARLGGDEFVVLFTSLANVDQAEHAIGRLIDLVREPIVRDGVRHVVSASLGCTFYPLDDAEPDGLLRHADVAMYEAKGKGGNGWKLFHLEDRGHSEELANRLRQAMAAKELVLFYQPQVDLRRGTVLGFEALLRWQDPERGLVMPGDFLPVVERSAFIEQIDDYVLDLALTQAGDWHRRGHAWRISVNISGRHVLKDGFVETLEAALHRHPDLPPGVLCIEVTESSALTDMARAVSVIERCRALGLMVAVDDFGTGFASLAYLRQLPCDEIKIDQSFVRDMLDDRNDLALVEGVISLAAVFGRTTLAEGVETAEHGVLLMHLGCDRAQGYGIARPMPAANVERWVEAWRPHPAWALWADTPWELADFPLLLAEYDHLRWIRQVLLYVEGGNLHMREEELVDPQHCRFGHWYYSHGKDRYRHLPEFRQIEAVHNEVHALGRDIAESVRNGDIDAARKRCPDLIHSKDRILTMLTALHLAVQKSSTPAKGASRPPEVEQV
jgi:diguanylate cyclase (GGDEF)-like protein